VSAVGAGPPTPADDHAGYRALRDGLGAVRWARATVEVDGPDAEAYLQGQTSQDLAKLAPGEWAWALVLQPQGKLDAFVRVYRAGVERFVLDTDAGMGEALIARLQRFKLRTKVDIHGLEWQWVAVRGASAVTPGMVSAGPVTAGVAPTGTIAVGFQWNELRGYDLAGPHVDLPPGAVLASAQDYETTLIEAGFPRHGSELDERTIPAEAGLVGSAVSFTKGCYTGQELVARIDSRGNNVPRRLWGLLVSGPVTPGAQLDQAPDAEGAGVGHVTSVAVSPRLGWVALGYLRRSVGQGATVWARSDAGAVQAQVAALPL
jgi:tRNA-modifying protein YgfZ